MTSRLFLLLSAASFGLLYAHGAVHEQIERLDRAIAGESRNATLFIKRGELHRLDLNWSAAAADFDAASTLDPAAAAADLGRARLAADRGQLRMAESLLDRYLAAHPQSETGFALRADVRDRAGLNSAAAQDYAAAIQMSAEPRIDYYLGQAQTLARDGRDDQALAAADAGISRLGPLAVLEQWAAEFLVQRRRWDEALLRQDRLIAAALRKETALTRRAEILFTAGRTNDAIAAYETAHVELEKLPERLRQTPAMISLRSRIDTGLSGTASRSPQKKATGASSGR